MVKKRSEAEMMALILSKAKADDRIRAVILNGSRVNIKIEKDEFQDFDVIYLVNELVSFKNEPNWIDVFGERIILQMPNSMKLDEYDLSSEKEEITYLMLFKDHNRIDLKLIEVKNRHAHKDSLSKILLDKDQIFKDILEPNDRDYCVKRPTQKEFSDCCNEFWWVSTYVVKGIARDEILYAKEMLEEPVRKMFMRMLAWYVGSENGFLVDIGKSNRFMHSYLKEELWLKILATHPDANIGNIKNSLKIMIDVFDEIGLKVADRLDFFYNKNEADNVRKYIFSVLMQELR